MSHEGSFTPQEHTKTGLEAVEGPGDVPIKVDPVRELINRYCWPPYAYKKTRAFLKNRITAKALIIPEELRNTGEGDTGKRK